ncbi:endo alpha-1,4 polygalactosaminidase [Streptomyces sp. NPDC049837]|uniref:endo alpha-1,4 polygalactosaminidase n=1 Tax=Streptomyces sp. NPDC049837 TaxID=3155277 RepID=UPI00342F04C0
MPARAVTAVLCLLAVAGCTVQERTKPVTPDSPPPVVESSSRPEGSWWRPRVGVSWQVQLQGRIDTSVRAEVYDVDLFDVPEETIQELHRQGRKVICYVNVGAHETWRPDADRFPEEGIGKPLEDWPGERWLDIRRLDVLEPIMAARMDLCKRKGFDAVDPDNVNGYRNDSGFPLTADDQLRYNRMVARLAHERRLGVALKNDLAQVPDLVRDFDFAINEECVAKKECEALEPFIEAGKAVLHVEYNVSTEEFCPLTKALHFSSIRKPKDLSAGREPCP